MVAITKYRAKKIDSDEYIEGNLRTVKRTKASGVHVHYCIETDEDFFNNHEIDPSTLAIHLPNMIDSEGTNIFASLSEDGEGGDIVNLGYNRITDTMKLNKSLFIYSFEKSKVTGVKK